MAERGPEYERDQVESAFTPILRGLWESVEGILAVVFVDTEGECIDYVSSVEPYDAKVTGAHMLILMDAVRYRGDQIGGGRPYVMDIVASGREIMARQVSEEYLLVVLLLPGTDRDELHNRIDAAGRAFRDEVGIEAPTWEPAGTVNVTLREAVGWAYAPSAYQDGDLSVTITEVLGRWTETGRGARGDDLVCFRVRSEKGRELTLIHDPDADGWQIRS